MHNRDGRDLKREMERYEGNIDKVILKCRATSVSSDWLTVMPWHWRPVPKDTHFQPLIVFPEFPIQLSAAQSKALWKVYNSLILRRYWLKVLLMTYTPVDVDEELPSLEVMEYNQKYDLL